jgi:endonuclease/exonuclease/phosphatase family metal-dependent hydrolase
MISRYASQSSGAAGIFSAFVACVASAGRRRAVLLAAILIIMVNLVAGSTPIRAQERDDDHNRANHVRVLTQNMYFGANFTALNTAKTLPELLAAVTTAYQNILASKPEERVAAMAREIAKARPDFVALHEAMILRIGALSNPTIVKMDLLQSMLDELAALGEHYALVTTVNGVDAVAPTTLANNDFIHLIDRDAILMRTDAGIATIGFKAQYFPTSRTRHLPPPFPDLVTPGGYVSIDAIVRGLPMRFVSVHLDPACASLSGSSCSAPDLAIQLQQTKELLQLAADTTTLPLVFAGDFNTAANDPSHPTYVIYQALLDAGLTDVWKRGNPGFTCCQDEDLLNAKSKLIARIDLILFRGDFGVGEVNLIGDKPSDKTPSGLWPSDHAGVTATLTGPEERRHRDDD